MACGTGRLAGFLSVKGAHVTAIDFAPEMIELARREAPAATFKEADCERLPFAEASFESVVRCFGALHFERPDAVFSQAYRVLKPGGKFVFTVWRGPEDGGEFLGMILGVYQLHADVNVNLPAGPAMFDLADKVRTTERPTRIGFENPVIRARRYYGPSRAGPANTPARGRFR
jgi:SAM-dependent methyltransferase